VLFQVLDDYLNLNLYADKKGFCDDLSEGKFSFPVISAIHADPDNPLLPSILRQKSQDQSLKACALKYMEDVGAFEHTRGFISKLKARCLGLLKEVEEKLGPSSRQGCDMICSIIEAICII
jgi:geranylgeranyl diphosphate synthase type 3